MQALTKMRDDVVWKLCNVIIYLKIDLDAVDEEEYDDYEEKDRVAAIEHVLVETLKQLDIISILCFSTKWNE